MNQVKCALKLKRLVFDRIEFVRRGFASESDLKYKMQVTIGADENKEYKVTLNLEGDKEEEYHFSISLSGYFEVESNDIDNVEVQDLIKKNAVAIIMPYLRSEVSLLTAQPGMECIVLPPFNIVKMLEKND